MDPQDNVWVVDQMSGTVHVRPERALVMLLAGRLSGALPAPPLNAPAAAALPPPSALPLARRRQVAVALALDRRGRW